MKSKNTCSCGFILVDSKTKGWLLAHPTNKGPIWDFPKGAASPGETHLAAAVRELREETGIVLTEEAIQRSLDFGQHVYNDRKDMHLFMTEVPLDPSTMFCMSWVPSLTGPEFPEMDDYQVLPRDEALKCLSPRKQAWLAAWVLPKLAAC